MFCPTIRSECRGEKCRDWNSKAGACQIHLDRKLYSQVVEQQTKIVEIEKFNVVWFKLSVGNLLSDPRVPEEAKEIIRQAMQAPTAEVAERLLREAGLIT